MNTTFALVLTVYLVSGEPVDIGDWLIRFNERMHGCSSRTKIPR